MSSDNSNNFACPKYVFVLYQNDKTAQLFGLAMGRMDTTGVTKFSELKSFRVIFLIFGGGIIAAFADSASQRYHNAVLFTFSHISLRSCSGPGLPLTGF